MKNLFLLVFITIVLSSCSTYRYEIGKMSTQDQAQKINLLNEQERKEERMQNVSNNQDENNLLFLADKNSLLRIKEARSKAIEDMAATNQKRSISVRSYNGYEAAYFYQVVSSTKNTSENESFLMNLLLINKTRKRNSYRSTDPNSVTAKVYLVEPKEAKLGFQLKEAKIIRQVAAVRLSAEGKEIISLPSGFYRVDFISDGRIVYYGPVTLNPQHKVRVSAEDVSGTTVSVDNVDGMAFVTL